MHSGRAQAFSLAGPFSARSSLHRASIAEVGNFAQTFLGNLHVNIDWLPLALIAGVIIWLLAYSDIALSTVLL